MRRWMDGVFSRYGETALLESGGTKQVVQSLFRSVSSEAWQNVERMYIELGNVPRGRYVCLLPALSGAQAQDTLTVRGKSYLLCRVEELAIRGQVLALWCLCVEKGGT